MAYGFHSDLTKAVVGEIYEIPINEQFSSQSSRNVTYNLPDGWNDGNTVIVAIGVHWFDSQFYYGTTYGNLDGSSFDGWTIRASVISDGVPTVGKCVLTLKYKQSYTGDFLGKIVLMKVSD